ncbi:type IV secretory system conjugative DNA transfer family protein [Myxosarcina sp. GI1]|uniref:type IV secretory system conjugative DNA transfer family protein n=1 Tax=Myxosarcina sp. GI1 TaxID=1541065 RepID=UPI0005625FC9|nr:type IV secretory system conjugative DNA transfer family protein [Myxosarcina sp. GI1]
MSKRIKIETHSAAAIPQEYRALLKPFFQTEVLALIACFAFLMCFNLLLGRNRKGILANARFSGRQEKLNAIKAVLKQRQKKDLAKTAVFAGEPLDGWKPQLKVWLTGKLPSLPLPSLNQHLIALGSTGCGKTTTVVNRVIQAAIRDGHPLIVFDPKGELAQINAPYAKAHDYEDYYLAPGKPYTDRFNIVEWMRGHKDSTRAQQIAKTIQANAKTEGAGKTDDFFSGSGEILLRSILMLTKGSDYPDLLMAKRILGLPDLCDRLQAAYKTDRLNLWIENSFQQFMTGKASSKQIAGVAATAGLIFDNFTQEEFFNAFIGKSTIPMNFTGKKILFVQPPIDKKDIVMPVLTTAIEILVEENMSLPRTQPLLLMLEEFPLGYWRKAEKWMTYDRSNGLAVFLIAQLWSQIRKRYGQDEALTILANANTQIFFNSNDMETAKMLSERCGQKEVIFKQHSNSNGKSGHSHSSSEQRQKTSLKSPDELTKVEEAEFVMFNPDFKARGEARVPLYMKYKMPQEILDRDENMKQVWTEYVYPERCQQAATWHLDEKQREAALIERREAAEKLLPFEDTSLSNDSDYGVLKRQREEFASYV